MKKLLKKSLMIVSVFAILAVFLTPAVAFGNEAPGEENILSQIVEAFNSSKIHNKLEVYGTKFEAAVSTENSNVLAITMTDAQNNVTVINYELDGDILGCDSLTDKTVMSAAILADVLQQLQGYDDGQIFENFNIFPEDVREYTLEEEGFEIKETEDGYSVKMDVTMKFPLIDVSNFYLKPSTFSIIKDILERGNYGNQTGKVYKIAYDVFVSEDESTITMGEQGDLTKSTYKSILAAIQVLFGEKAVDYFYSKYPKLEDGNFEFDGFKVECDAEIDTEEKPMFAGTKVVVVEFDNKYMNDVVLRTEYIGETVEGEAKNITLDFTNNNEYTLNYYDSISSSDVAFAFKYIFEPAFEEAELIDGIAYFDIKDGKIVAGDKENSVIKMEPKDTFLLISTTKADSVKTTKALKYDGLKSKEYKEGATSEDMFRYVAQDVTLNVIYGDKPSDYRPNPDTGIIDIFGLKVAFASEFLK